MIFLNLTISPVPGVDISVGPMREKQSQSQLPQSNLSLDNLPLIFALAVVLTVPPGSLYITGNMFYSEPELDCSKFKGKETCLVTVAIPVLHVTQPIPPVENI